MLKKQIFAASVLTFAAMAQDVVGQPCADGAWWRNFGDPVIDTLVTLAIDKNYDVAMAVRRVDIARDALGSARAGYYPTIGVSGSYQREQASGLVSGRTGRAVRNGFFDVGANVSWEADIFGKVRSGTNAAGADVKVSAAERDGVMLSVVAQTIDAYVVLRQHQMQVRVADEHSANQEEALRIAQARFDSGIASMMDVEQARQVYYSTRASIPGLKAAIVSDLNTLMVLTGTPVPEIASIVGDTGVLPDYRHLVPAQITQDMLDSRPDVQQAAGQVEAQAAQLGLAKKDWLPSVTVTATGGTQAHNGKDLFGRQSLYWTVAPTISWTVFDGLSRKFNVASQRKSLQNAVDSYNLTVMQAVGETDNAIAAYKGAVRQIEILAKVNEAAAHYDKLALDNYRSGLSPFINVADAQMSLLADINSYIEAHSDALADLVTLYKAVGGHLGNGVPAVGAGDGEAEGPDGGVPERRMRINVTSMDLDK